MEAIKLIDEAVENGARLSAASEMLGITERTYYRWRILDKTYNSYEDRRTYADHSDPANKLKPEERQRMEYSDQSNCAWSPGGVSIRTVAFELIKPTSSSTLCRNL